MTLAALIKKSREAREAWRYTSLAPFADVALSKALRGDVPTLPAPLTRHRLVFIDGVYRDELSARQELPDEFFSLCDGGENCCALSLLGQTCLAVDPIELLFVSTVQQAANEAETTIKVSLGPNSRMTLIERHVVGAFAGMGEHQPETCGYPLPLAGRDREGGERLGAGVKCASPVLADGPPPYPSPQGGGDFIALAEKSCVHVKKNGQDEKVKSLNVRHIRMEIDLAAQSKLVHGRIVAGGESALHFSKTNAKVEAGAFYDHFALVCGGRLTRCEHDVALQGKLAEARMLGVMLLDGAAHGDITALVRHLAPHGTSRQICKTVLKDKARGVFQGKVHVAKGAQKTDGYQLSRALLLSDKAEMDAKPELEIYADDVKCSHGSTIGDLDEQALFYMISRGIDAQTARAMLIEAFVQEIIDMCNAPDVVAVAREEVGRWLDRT